MRVLRHHLELVIEAANSLPAEKRPLFLERVKARLALYGGRLTDAELNDAIGLALTGLTQQAQPAA